MTVIAWANDMADFINFYGVENTNPGAVGFNGNLVRHCVQVSPVNGESHRAQLTDDAWGGAARSNLRWQFAYVNTGVGSNSFADMSGQFVRFYDLAGGRELVRLVNLSTNSAPSGSTQNCQLRYWNGSAWIDIGLPFPVPTVYSTITITIRLHATLGVISVHLNGALMATLTGNTIFTASTTIDTISHWSWGSCGTGPITARFAEHILADYDFMTYGLHVTDPDLTGAGTNATQASGVTADVNDYPADTGSAMAFTAAGQKYSGALRDLDASLNTTAIMGVRLSALVRRGATGPQTMKFGFHQAAWVTGAARTINGVGYTPIATPFLLNPATSAPFTPAQINAATFEPGVEAAA